MGLLTSYCEIMEHRWDKDKDKKSSSSDNGDTPTMTAGMPPQSTAEGRSPRAGRTGC
jgi:hypothetical protein